MCSLEESQAEINLILVSNYFKPKKRKSLNCFMLNSFRYLVNCTHIFSLLFAREVGNKVKD